jgi:hypothetical protein
MRRLICGVGLVLALVISPTAFAQDKKPDDKKPDDKATPKDKDGKALAKDKDAAVEKLHVGGEITGKLTQWGSNDKSFTVKVTVRYAELNQSEYKAMLQEELYAADPARTVQDRRNHAIAAVEHQAKLYSVKSTDIDFQFSAGADMKVRTANPVVFDDKGKPKKLSQLTKKERDELKGPDKSLPGYNAEMNDVHPDQYVTVYLPKKKAGKTTAKDDKPLADTKREAVMLLILGDSAPPK